MLDLVDAGLVEPGEQLVSEQKRAGHATAVIHGDGQVQVTGGPIDESLSAAAHRVIGSKNNLDGIAAVLATVPTIRAG